MQLTFRTIRLHKRFPLAIARGVKSASDNLFISLRHQGITGYGEMSPGQSEGAATPVAAQHALEQLAATGLNDLSVQQIYARGRQQGTPPCALAALDIALWDWLGKRAGLPLYALLGWGRATQPCSMTLGINPPEVVRERVPLLLQRGAKLLKIKLGSPQGEDADRAMFAAVVESTKGHNIKLRVDANGGWDLPTAQRMLPWLAAQGAEYVEQPLAEGAEAELPALFKQRALPIYVDESCRFANDIPRWADCVDGVNLKLMKCGGISGALHIIATARACGLKTMLGCMGESSLSISAAAALSGALDHIDLDSHLNLTNDPCHGATLVDGILLANDLPGHGARFYAGQSHLPNL